MEIKFRRQQVDAQHIYRILIKSGYSQQIATQVHNIKFHGKPSSRTALKHPGERTAGRTWKYFALFRDYANAPTKCPTFVVFIRVPEHTFRINGNLTFRGPCIVIYSYNKRPQDTQFLRFIWWSTLHVSDKSTVHHQEYLNTIHATGICHSSSVDCLLAWSWPC